RPMFTLDHVFMPLSNVYEVNCALRDPGIRYALATERAFRFENRIVKELGLEAQSPPVPTADFKTTIARYSLLYKEFARVIAWESMKYEAACGKLVDSERQERAELLSGIVLRFTGSGQTRPMRDLLVEPQVGPFQPDFDGGGPRPRMGGGWGT